MTIFFILSSLMHIIFYSLSHCLDFNIYALNLFPLYVTFILIVFLEEYDKIVVR